MEILAKPGVGGILERYINGDLHILIQERFKDENSIENGLIEIPAGKVRAYENVYDCLRREVKEETGLNIDNIQGESDSTILEGNGYKVLNYMPFSNSQNIDGYYPIMVQVFICQVSGDLLYQSNESRNIRWISLQDLSELLSNNCTMFYPMHVETLKKYLKVKLADDVSVPI